jgi:hypothetical protein
LNEGNAVALGMAIGAVFTVATIAILMQQRLPLAIDTAVRAEVSSALTSAQTMPGGAFLAGIRPQVEPLIGDIASRAVRRTVSEALPW